MNRRTFLVTTAMAAGAMAVPPAAESGSPRHYDLNRNWRFKGKSGQWERVTLPHSNARLPWHSFEEKDFQFVSSYQRTFQASPAWKGKRVFLDFAGAMTATKVTVNGHAFEEYKGGYTPFSFEITPHLKLGAPNVIDVSLDSTERKDIPPFGENIDYLTFGGIYRDVSIRVVPQTFIENIFATPLRPLADDRALRARCYLNGSATGTLTLELRDGSRVLKSATREVSGSAEYHEVQLESLGAITLWDLDNPKLYTVAAIFNGDALTTRIGFREAKFTPAGFRLNGTPVKLRGLNRHQTYPYLGAALPARVQRRDAQILKQELHCNIVRTSHYPQAISFLDACDELGLLVFEEIPGWQFVSKDPAWQDLCVRNVEQMIQRDWNHPAIVLWGVRVNESMDQHDLYTRTNAAAHKLDDSRQTGGVRYLYDSELLEDVFTMNDFGFPLRQPNHPLYLNTEFNGHMFSTKRFDNVTRVAEHVSRHARVHDQLASDEKYAGGFGWCAFDYNTHSNFGSGDHICYHGVSDIFRIPKPAAYFYKSQIEPEKEVVLEAGFFWSSGDHSTAAGTGPVPILSNCERLKIYYDGVLKRELEPDRKTYPSLKYPPFVMDMAIPLHPWGDLKIEGYIQGKLVKTLKLSGSGKDADLKVLPDDKELIGDGRDATRVCLMVTDEYGNILPFATGAVSLMVTGPGEIIGENPFAITGGTGAIWIKSRESAGVVRLTATHPYLGSRTVEIQVKAAAAELI